MAPRRPLALVVAAFALACPKPPPPAPEKGKKPPASVEAPAPKPAPKTEPAPKPAPVVGTPLPRWTPPVLDPASPEAQEIDRIEDLRADPAGRLLALAKDARPEVRARAVLALGRMRKVEYADALSAALADTDPATRRVAAFGASSLGDNAPRALVDALAKRLSAESDAGVASECALALGRVGKDTDAPALLAALEKAGSQVGAALGLGLLAQRNQALPALAEEKLAPLLASPTREARFAGAYALMRAKRVTPALLAASKSESEIDTLAAIARALGSKDEAHGATLDDARQALRPLLENSAWKVRVEAVRSLSKLSPSPTDAVAALDAQISAEQKAFSPTMSAATLHPTLSAIEVLDASLSAALESGASVAPLAGVSSLYTYAGDALAKSPSAAQIPGLDAAHCGAATLLDISAQKGPEKVKTCGSKAAAWRRGLSEIKVIQAGRKKDEKAAREALAKLLPSKDARVRSAAIEALGGIPGPEAAGLVRKSLADKDFAVSATAVDAITNRAKAEKPEVDKEAVKPLLALLDRYPSPSDAEAIIAVYKALSAVADPADKALPVAIARGLADPNAAVVAAAKDAQKALNVTPATGKIKALPASKAKGPKAGEAVKVPARGAKAVVTTTQGAFSFELLVDTAPRTAANFASLARAGYFDGIVFHRVVADFVAQGGDPRGDGWGGPGYAIRDENSPLPYETGAVGMALSGPDTGGSQWFIMHGYQPHLDSRYPLFGKVVEGQEVVDSLQVGDKMLSVKISE